MKKILKIILKILISLVGVFFLLFLILMFDLYLEEDRVREKYTTTWEDDVFRFEKAMAVGKGIFPAPSELTFDETNPSIPTITIIDEFEENFSQETITPPNLSLFSDGDEQ